MDYCTQVSNRNLTLEEEVEFPGKRIFPGVSANEIIKVLFFTFSVGKTFLNIPRLLLELGYNYGLGGKGQVKYCWWW